MDFKGYFGRTLRTISVDFRNIFKDYQSNKRGFFKNILEIFCNKLGFFLRIVLAGIYDQRERVIYEYINGLSEP